MAVMPVWPLAADYITLPECDRFPLSSARHTEPETMSEKEINQLVEMVRLEVPT
jgi:hypothetical protein